MHIPHSAGCWLPHSLQQSFTYSTAICVSRSMQAWGAAHLPKIPRAHTIPQRQVSDLVPSLYHLAQWHQDVEVQQAQERAWAQQEDVVDCLRTSFDAGSQRTHELQKSPSPHTKEAPPRCLMLVRTNHQESTDTLPCGLQSDNVGHICSKRQCGISQRPGQIGP